MANRESTLRIVVHCSATRPSMDVGAADIDRWHRAKGWAKIGYHHVIRRNGKIEKGRSEAEVGAHAVGPDPNGGSSRNWWNQNSIGVCWVGGVEEDSLGPEDNRTPEQKASLEMLLRDLLKRYPGAQIIGHRDIPGVHKACPSFDVAAWLRSVGL